MNPLNLASRRLQQLVARGWDAVARRWRHRFYFYLALLFSLFVLADAGFLHLGTNLRQVAYDMSLRLRVLVPKPDPQIVIVDINEASLAAMAPEYGRWPWPRQVLGEFLDQIEQQQPAAVVFDILFSDPDLYNPDSDAYFNSAVGRTANTWFPMLRLDPASDSLSELTADRIPGATRIDGEAKPGATFAMVLPPFPAILGSGRLGLHNIEPDRDGIVRRYPVYRSDHGWRIPSLPAAVVRGLGLEVPDQPTVLLNWRGKPFSYPTVSFSDVYFDMQRKERTRPADEFRGKIVLIGSTAPSLFDVKPTPLANLHPGVEILATALDNLKNSDYLHAPEGRITYPLITLLLLWATALAFYREAGRARVDRIVGASQLILLAVTYASINLTRTYIDLTGPVAVTLAYFSIARLYSVAAGRALEYTAVRASMEGSGELHAVLLLMRLTRGAELVGDAALEQLRRALESTGKPGKSVEIIKGRQKGLWSLLEHTFAVSWVVPAGDEAALAQVRADPAVVVAELERRLPGLVGDGDNVVRWYVQEGRIAAGADAGADWRVMLAQALLRWDEQEHTRPKA